MLEKNKEKRPDWFDLVKYNKNDNSNNNNNNDSNNNSGNNVEMGAFSRGTSGQNEGPELLLTALTFGLPTLVPHVTQLHMQKEQLTFAGTVLVV
jgi:hypothetical protein